MTETTRPRGLDSALVRELDVAAPRYTSYPPIPLWKPARNDSSYAARLRRPRGTKPLSLYFHIPFCQRICSYCGCNTQLLTRPELLASYARDLETELRAVRSRVLDSGPVEQIHFGGGTPTVLEERHFRSLLELLVEEFAITRDAELALETNPMTCSEERLRLLAELGFNRISIGVQDFDASVQHHIGRNQTYEVTARFARLCRQLGFPSVNFDLVYGLPGQTLSSMDATLDRVIELEPDRVAVYSFAYLPQLRENQRAIEEKLLPVGENKLDLYLLVRQRLTAAGYRHVGMDHFALENDELALAHRRGLLRRNFMGYTTKPETDVLAFGATAISDLGDYYCQNLKDLDLYHEAVTAGRLPVHRELALDEDDQVRREVIMSILCNGMVSKALVAERYGIEFGFYFQTELKRLAGLGEKGLVVVDNEEIRATELGAYFLRNLALVFDNYLDGRKGEPARPAFSRTV